MNLSDVLGSSTTEGKYQLPDGSFTSDFFVWCEREFANSKVTKTKIKSEMDEFSIFVQNLCLKRNQHFLSKAGGDHWNARQLLRNIETDAAYLAEKTYLYSGRCPDLLLE